jgi:hypothetical protein
MPQKHEPVCLRHQSYSFKNSKLSVNLFYMKYFSIIIIEEGILAVIEIKVEIIK